MNANVYRSSDALNDKLTKCIRAYYRAIEAIEDTGRAPTDIELKQLALNRDSCIAIAHNNFSDKRTSAARRGGSRRLRRRRGRRSAKTHRKTGQR